PGDGTLGNCSVGSPPGQDGAVRAGIARSYTDNGDGTITDNVTRLMWEKLSDDGSIHDFDDAYDWYMAFNVKIATLNATGFAGHSDWRLPNRFELETLVDLGRSSLAIDPEFNSSCSASCTVTTCSCTQPGPYWSSTSVQDFPTRSWFVEFAYGGGAAGERAFDPPLFFVRAVRPASWGSPPDPTPAPHPPPPASARPRRGGGEGAGRGAGGHEPCCPRRANRTTSTPVGGQSHAIATPHDPDARRRRIAARGRERGPRRRHTGAAVPGGEEQRRRQV